MQPLGSQRSDYTRGSISPFYNHVLRRHGHLGAERPHDPRRLRPALPEVDADGRRLYGGSLQLHGRLHAREQQRLHPDRAVAGPVPPRHPDLGREQLHRREHVRASTGRPYHCPVRSGRVVAELPPDRELRPARRDGHRPARDARPEHHRLRPHDRQSAGRPPQRAAYATNPIAEIPVDQFHVLGGLLYEGRPIYDRLITVLPRTQRLVPDWTRRPSCGAGSASSRTPTSSTPSTRPASRSRRSSSPRTTAARRSSPTSTTRSRTVSTTPPGSSQGLLTWAGRDLVADATAMIVNSNDRKSPIYTRWQLGAQRDLGAGWMVQLDYVGSRGKNLPFGEISTTCPSSTSRPRARVTRRRRRTSRQRGEPLRRAPPGHHAQRLDDPEAAAPQAVSRVPAGGGHGVQRLGLLQRGPAHRLQAIPERVVRHRVVHPVQGYGEGELSQRVRHRSSRSARRRTTGRSGPRSVQPSRFRSARAASGATSWGKVMQAIFGGWNVSALVPVPARFPDDTRPRAACRSGGGTSTSIPPASWKDLKVGSVGSKNSQGKIIGLDVPAWDTTCFYFHDAAVQTNGVDDPAEATGRSANQPRKRHRRYFPTILDNMRMPDSPPPGFRPLEVVRLRSRGAAPDPDRRDQRDQLHRVLGRRT